MLLGLLDVDAQALKARQDGATCIHLKTLKQLVALAAGGGRTGNQGQAGWGNLHTFQGAGALVCLGLLDVDAQALKARQDGQLAYI